MELKHVIGQTTDLLTSRDLCILGQPLPLFILLSSLILKPQSIFFYPLPNISLTVWHVQTAGVSHQVYSYNVRFYLCFFFLFFARHVRFDLGFRFCLVALRGVSGLMQLLRARRLRMVAEARPSRELWPSNGWRGVRAALVVGLVVGIFFPSNFLEVRTINLIYF
jgi:hypothetical protein